MRRGKGTEHPSASLLGDASYPGVIEMKFFLQPARPIVEPAQQFFDWRSRRWVEGSAHAFLRGH